MTPSDHAALAETLAVKASQASSQLKVGSWDSVNALALCSIAHSLAAMAKVSKGAAEQG